jgi:hypothetical protein
VIQVNHTTAGKVCLVISEKVAVLVNQDLQALLVTLERRVNVEKLGFRVIQVCLGQRVQRE